MIIAFSGGKGGTGKSTVSTNIAVLLEYFALVDLDVEAPDDHILLSTELVKVKDVNLFQPVFNHDACFACGRCLDACHDSAIISGRDGKPILIPELCGGCRGCKLICPSEEAIKEGGKFVGRIYENLTPYGFPLITGELLEGEEKTYRVLLETRRYAVGKYEKLIFDTAAGAGNSIFKALEGVDVVVAVTEPTPFGVRDLEKILEVTKRLERRTVVVINRSGTGDESVVESLCDRYGVKLIGRIPYSENVMKSYFENRPIVKTDLPEAEVFKELKDRILEEACK
ncbi:MULTISPECIES: nucleotide-binding protein [unclassified Desulfurobacterium]|uniref:nucleotide-binding protein n=1 Tax=Desulfurobacterium sp. TC5-1 TaxID=1158318 RepID=UPI0003B69D1B|nr:ATP-binding protein [Desulfurobacterium sp. TC5-1]